MVANTNTDVGCCRSLNQDYCFGQTTPVGPFPNLFIVADGMGGHKAGDYASRYAVNQMIKKAQHMREKDISRAFIQLIDEVNCDLYEISEGNEDFNGMGTTLVACCILGDCLYVANVGDSRLYICGERFRQITKDHSLVEELAELGKIERGSEMYQLQKNIITRAVGIRPTVTVDVFKKLIKKDDLVLLCSDGLSNMVSDREIEEILRAEDDLIHKTDRLVSEANQNGGRDNITVILIDPELNEEELW